MAPKNVLCEQNEVDMSIALTAMVYYPTHKEVSEYLKKEHGIQCSPAKLKVIENRNQEQLAKLRAENAPKIEARQAADMLDTAGLATEVEQAAIIETRRLLKNGRLTDPSKVARDLADVKAKNIDKKLALESRPTQITENRRPEDIIRALEGMGIMQQETVTDAEVVEPKQLQAA